MGHCKAHTGEDPVNVEDKTSAATVDTGEAANGTANGDNANPVPDHGRPQVFHGAFSECDCDGCLEEAKKEAEKRFDNNTLAFKYIKKLEGLVNQLQLQTNDDVDQPYRNIYHQGRMRHRDSIESSGMPFGLSGAAGRSRTFGASEQAVVIDGDTKHGPKVEIKRMKKTFDHYGALRIERDRTTPNELMSAHLANEYVLSTFREFDRKKNYWRKSLEIRSPPFVELLRTVAYSQVDLPAADAMFRVKEPLMPLFYNRAKLIEHLQTNSVDAKDTVAVQTHAHTKLILDFMEKECQDVVSVQEELASGDLSNMIKYEYAWLLYAPGSIVFSKENGEYEAFVVESIRGCQRHQPDHSGRFTHSSMEIICWSINYDGEIFGRVWSTHYIAPFDGPKEIASMPLVPEAFVPDRLAVKASLVERGQQFWALQGQCFREYTGEVWSSRMNEDPIRVMVDHLTYQKRSNWPIEVDRKRGPADAQSKNWREDRYTRGRRTSRQEPPYPPPAPHRPVRGSQNNHVIFAHGDDRDYSPERFGAQEQHEEAYERIESDRPPQSAKAFFKKYDVLKPETEPDEVVKLLCPQIVHGYCLRDKVWKRLNVTQLRPVNFRKNAWERLVLDEEYKEIIQAMVSSYVDKTAGIDDLIAGKGAGLVTLLHGPPGTGKTLTAECVAESFGKPLYQVTCGEIGTHASRLEERLEEIFDDAVTWGAILVLDEADVFLQERDYEFLERNALVSVFLRTLEYFNGILFLTTNRVGTFDQAFQSRIHITLGLPILDQPRRTEVWMLFLHELGRSQHLTPAQLHDLQGHAAAAWSRQPLNGRQIRNSVRTALLVAEKKKEAVGQKHFETVLRIGREFESYMNVLRKGEADVVAEVKGDRLADLGGFQEV
ncbi:MAG: hypothetical protein L6R35_001358 [Caloplaca aegaea]|nr:MAG: hypothetical protein L6R35_001358 [Caloplaca aegaea]